MTSCSICFSALVLLSVYSIRINISISFTIVSVEIVLVLDYSWMVTHSYTQLDQWKSMFYIKLIPCINKAKMYVCMHVINRVFVLWSEIKTKNPYLHLFLTVVTPFCLFSVLGLRSSFCRHPIQESFMRDVTAAATWPEKSRALSDNNRADIHNQSFVYMLSG